VDKQEIIPQKCDVKSWSCCCHVLDDCCESKKEISRFELYTQGPVKWWGVKGRPSVWHGKSICTDTKKRKPTQTTDSRKKMMKTEGEPSNMDIPHERHRHHRQALTNKPPRPVREGHHVHHIITINDNGRQPGAPALKSGDGVSWYFHLIMPEWRWPLEPYSMTRSKNGMLKALALFPATFTEIVKKI